MRLIVITCGVSGLLIQIEYLGGLYTGWWLGSHHKLNYGNLGWEKIIHSFLQLEKGEISEEISSGVHRELKPRLRFAWAHVSTSMISPHVSGPFFVSLHLG